MTATSKVAVIDYGLGNLRSVCGTLRRQVVVRWYGGSGTDRIR
ncbi:MAG TPA: hypothetical protein O0X23_01490 [Methanocorpusculum sp.]|nr:hypothetical protein [Methanocorpusculum sp.]